MATVDSLSTFPAPANARLQQTMQQRRLDSAMLSTLAGPSSTFFPEAALPPVPGGTGGIAAPPSGPEAYSPIGVRERLNVPLLETMQEGRVSSALFSSLMTPASRFFPPPVPPVLTPPLQGPVAAPAGPPPAQAAGSPSAAPRGVIPPAATPLLEAEQQGRVASALLSGVMRPGAEWSWEMGPPATSGPVVSPYFATQAYRTEMNAPRGAENPATGASNGWQWFG